MKYHNIKVLTKKDVMRGAYYLISADFNASERIIEFKDDLSMIKSAGGIGIVLAHKGRFGDKKDNSLSSEARKVGAKYFEDSYGDKVKSFIDSLKDGEAVVLGNVRNNSGEEKNDKALAKKYFDLVSDKDCYFVSADFGKAHRMNSSNYQLPRLFSINRRFLSQMHFEKMRKLENWKGKSPRYSVAILGGTKKEKIEEGLFGLIDKYNLIIPGGVVLNTIYLAQRIKIGDSEIQEGKSLASKVGKFVQKYQNRIATPETVIIAKNTKSGFSYRKEIQISDGVPKGHMIVDFILPEKAVNGLKKVVKNRGRILLAGTPSLYKSGFRVSTNKILGFMTRNKKNSLVLGGDSVKELDFKGETNSGGGSALYFITHGTTPVLEALKK
jgi:phosphoglycerate kinase